jgi:signal transduction histidine kinase
MRSKIFIPNFTTKSSGTGLGLAMSKTIVEQAKGRIWFETAEDEGTTFFVELPVYDEILATNGA